MSKHDQALVNAQLEKEAKIRSNVAEIKRRLHRGLQTISHLVSGGIEELRSYVSPIIDLLLKGGALSVGHKLIGQEAVDVYLASLRQLKTNSLLIAAFRG